MNEHKPSGALVTTGIPSLFLIFSILCLVILSLMTLGTSRTDLTSSRNSLDQTEKYYEACTAASHLCAEIEQAFAAYSGSPQEACLEFAGDYLSQVPEVSVSDEGTYILSVPFTQVLSLRVDLEPVLTDSGRRPALKILNWYTAQDLEWTPDLHQNLFIPGKTSLK